MVVDDDNFTRELISMALRRHGYEVIAANDGLHAIMKAQDEKPDLLLLDVMLPDLSGLEVLNLLQSQFLIDIPAIIMSRIHHQKVVIAADRLGAIQYLEKPFEMSDLIEKIQTIPGFMNVSV